MKNEKLGEEIYLTPETNSSEKLISDERPGDSTNIEVPVMVETKPKTKFRVGEILDLRESNRKVYRMSDGSEQAVFYLEPVHVFDKTTNTFEEIDNTIIEEPDGRHLRNGKNTFIVKFSCEEENDELFSIENGMHRVTVSAKKNSKQRNKGVKPQIHKNTAEGIEKSNTLIFADVHNGSDYEYSLTGNGVKENIIIKDKSDVYRYSFVVHQENVTAQFNESNKRIAFVSNETGKEVFFIPAPFMTDANGVTSTAVSYEVKNIANGDMILNVVADSEWLNAQTRAFPVVIDPQIQLSGNSALTTYSWDNCNLYNASQHTIGTTGNGDGDCNAKRMYMSFIMPTLPRNPRIKKAELRFCQVSGVCESLEYPKFGLYQVNDNICTGTCTPYHESDLIDFAKMQIAQSEDNEVVSYTFDITTFVDQVNKGETGIKNLVLKMIDETSECGNNIVLYGSACSGDYAPQFVITYESGYGVNTSYRTHTHELGRFGQGSIDLQCGNLMFESDDFTWSGNRMPVTIKHLYNSALSGYQYTANSTIKLPTADFTAMKVGNGFKLNIMQSMVPATFCHEGEQFIGYVYIGENGEETYFKQSSKQACDNNTSQCYNLYENVNDSDMLYDPVTLTLKQGEDTYQFDSVGRLIQITDESGNHMDITYTSDRITSVTDGAGRDFWFAYSGDLLTSVTAPDDTVIQYTYSGDFLRAISYPDGKKVLISYTSNKPATVTMYDADNNIVYKVKYTFNGDRLESVTEYGSDESIGAKSTYSYSVASGRTIVQTTEQADDGEDETVINTVYTFDDEGNIVSEYVYSEDIGNIGINGDGSGIHPHSGDGGMGVVSNINNLLVGHNFETLDNWTSMPSNLESTKINSYAYEPYTKFGGKIMRMGTMLADCAENGIYQTTEVLPAGQYAFSVYLRVIYKYSGTNEGVFIRVTDTSGNVLGVSEHLTKYDTEYTRLIVPFEINSPQNVQVQILANGKGAVYADAAQLENNPYANAYNMLENGNFESENAWTLSSATNYSSNTCFNMSRSLCITGNLDYAHNAYQDVTVRTNRSTRETFTLSGWAKGYGLPNHERDGITTPTFRLRAVIKYYDTVYKEYDTEEFTADFSPCTEEWQFASIEFAKSKYRTVQYIRVYCDYDYNTGNAYFDDIQLVRNSIETNLTASDFVVETVDDTDVDTDTVETTDSTPTFEEVKDNFGNTLTETTFTDGEFGTIYRAFGFNADDGTGNAGNNLVTETDARGNVTTYTVDEDTSRNEEVTDRLGNKTAYEYDASGKTTKVISKDASDTELANVSYAYDAFDNMTEIVRGDGMKYALAYNAYHNLESIGVDGKDEKLVKYTYKTGNGRLKEIAYANGDKMKATYNGVGQMVAEKWYNSSDELTAHYKYVYDGQGNIVRSIDILGQKEYNYEYEDDRLLRATECDVVISEEEIIVSKVLVYTVFFSYGEEDKLVKKRIVLANGSERIIYHEPYGDEDSVIKFIAAGRTITAHSKTDSFGRKVFDELQLGTGFVSRQFHYHAGVATEEHVDNNMLKSSPTTQLVSQIVLSGGRTISYEYDEEERITKVDDSVDGITTYTYDALGQLVTETVNGITTKFKYDNYGNILAKGVVDESGKIAEATKSTYVYGDDTWKDLLTAYNGQPIVYDKQGNPTSYLGHTLTWEKGRQLKSFDDIQYTYNSNGIRTSKTVDGIKHKYALEGYKILSETWDENVLFTLYDNEDSICGIIYNNVPFYFQKNLQGDIIGIVDADAKLVAKYTYDCWGQPIITQDNSSCAIATINPYRYRGYYYDVETGFYYTSSRYYNPSLSRFLNADDAKTLTINETVLIKNLQAYCLNNPVNYTDITGYVVTPANVIGAVIGVVGGAILGLALANYFNLKGWKRWAVTASTSLLLGIVGWFAGPVIWKGIKAAVAYLITTGTMLYHKIQSWVANALGLTRQWLASIFGKAYGGLSRAAEYGLQSYKNLTKALKGTGLQAHHLIEQRFKLGHQISVAVTKAEHQVFTNAWRKLLPYGKSYTVNQVWNAAKKVYAKYPALLEAVRKALKK